MLRVFVPALQVDPRLTGVGMYTRELLRGMVECDRADLEIVVAGPHLPSLDFLQGVEGFRVLPLSLTREDSWGRMLANHTVVL